MLTREDAVRGVLLRGVDPAEEPKVSDIGKQFKAGHMESLQPGQFGIALGNELANAMGVQVGDKITLLAPQGTITPAGVLPRLKQFTVVGVFSSGHFEFDSALALVNIRDAETLFRMSGPTGVRLKLVDMQRAPQVANDLAGTLSGELYLRDWSKQNRNWFAAVQTEKRMMFIILTLIIAVAAFNLVSTLVMTVTDKQADIAILRTMGAQPGSIMKIFIVQGVAIGFIGTLLGVAGGTLIATNIDVIVPFIERLLHVQFLPRDIYFISELPSDPRVNDIATIGIISFVLATLATLYPSWRAPASTRRRRCAMSEAMLQADTRPVTAAGNGHARAARRRAVQAFPPGRTRRRSPQGRGRARGGGREGRHRRCLGLGQEHAAPCAGRARQSRRRPRGAARQAVHGAARARTQRGAQPLARLRLPVPSPAAGIHGARQRGHAHAHPRAEPAAGA